MNIASSHFFYSQPFVKLLQNKAWYLCPCCNGRVKPGGDYSQEAGRIAEVIIKIDERNSWAIPPIGSVPFVWQEYRFLQCLHEDCLHTWGHHPTGKWYSNPLSEEKQRELKRDCNVLRNYDNTIKFYDQVEKFSEDPPVREIQNQNIIIFNGAGLSSALGYPTLTKCFKQLPPAVMENLIEWLDKAPIKIQEAIKWDLEILFDILFYLQKLAIRFPDTSEYFAKLESRFQHVSDFCFNETLLLPSRIFYPPLYPLFTHKSVRSNYYTRHLQTVRNMIGDVANMVMRNYAEPNTQIRKNSDEIFPLLINDLRALNPGNSLAVFTTNYELALEYWCKRQNVSLRYFDGMNENIWQPTTNYDLIDNSVSHFYLHGCSRWAIHLEQENVMGFDNQVEEFADNIKNRLVTGNNQYIGFRNANTVRFYRYNYERMYMDPDQNLYPALLFPSTVKRRYTHSPPFNYTYQQLLEALKKVKILLIIGYAGRDETFKEIVFKAQHTNPNLQVVILDITDIPPHLSVFLDKKRIHLVKHKNGVCEKSLKGVIKLCKKLLRH